MNGTLIVSVVTAIVAGNLLRMLFKRISSHPKNGGSRTGGGEHAGNISKRL